MRRSDAEDVSTFGANPKFGRLAIMNVNRVKLRQSQELAMRISAFAIPVLLACASTSAWSHPRLSIQGEARMQRGGGAVTVTAHAGEPAARIRNISSSNGLSPIAFANWLASHSALAGSADARFWQASRATKRLNLISPLFAYADNDGNGRISADELADFVVSQGRTTGLSRSV